MTLKMRINLLAVIFMLIASTAALSEPGKNYEYRVFQIHKLDTGTLSCKREGPPRCWVEQPTAEINSIAGDGWQILQITQASSGTAILWARRAGGQ